MKTAGIVMLILGILSFLGCALGGNNVFGPCFWIAISLLLIHKGKEREKKRNNDNKQE